VLWERKFTTFEFPGAQDTFVSAINSSGTIAGYYTTNDGAPHGFLRSANGAFTAIQGPDGQNVTLRAINNAGSTAGIYYGPSGAIGFIRSADGAFTTF